MNRPSQRWLFPEGIPVPSPGRLAVAAAYLDDEDAHTAALLEQASLDAAARGRVRQRASDLVMRMRDRGAGREGVEAFLQEYDLSSEEGVVLMCLAEALLRIPDAATADRLIQDRFSVADWERHFGRSESWLVNAATWGLMLTGRLVAGDRTAPRDAPRVLRRLLAASGEPVIRAALREAMRIIGQQFVLGRTIEEALERGAGGRFSFDMLGEAALTAQDAERYYRAYRHAIDAIGAAQSAVENNRAEISIKLSALHPRFEFAQRWRLHAELVPRLTELAEAARRAGVFLTLDAEEAERLEPTLDMFEALARAPVLAGWDGLGLAVQTYQKRALALIGWLAALAREVGRRVNVRLVKGAYWDSEIKRAQQQGLPDYPVFTRKRATDVSYLACARSAFAAYDVLRPQFATHNAFTIASILELASGRAFEFQRLHGMGESLYREVHALAPEVPCRTYAPVGSHAELLPYLVRRLLENGANTSFVNRIENRRYSVEELVADPVASLRVLRTRRHPCIPKPVDLYQPLRRNSSGLNLNDPLALHALDGELQQAARRRYRATAEGSVQQSAGTPVHSPADRRLVLGEVLEARAEDVTRAFHRAAIAAADWDAQPVEARAAHLEAAADALEAARAELVYLVVREGGRCTPDALAEVREAVDFCRYYAALARSGFAERPLPGPSGESNRLRLHGRGVFACISPWNFPVAIFTGQIAAALVTGNCVLAKPARQTALTAARVVELMHRAGIPREVLQILPGSAAALGDPLLRDRRLAGVVFTGSTETAWHINRTLAARDGPIVPLIAETGGQNAMIVDSSALPEQVVSDVLHSAFNSAGQRCSALRLLFVQRDAAPRLVDMLCGAMAELQVGDPALLPTDVGPVIDDAARDGLVRHLERMAREATVLQRARLGMDTEHGSFFAPALVEIERADLLQREVFGPILHLVRFDAAHLDGAVDAVNATGYGLTLGVHSRIESTVRRIAARSRVGNVYVNRDMIGAVVGTQPFGGEGLSGTGPKAGGPHYLQRFAVERVMTVNTAAMGGDPALLRLEE